MQMKASPRENLENAQVWIRRAANEGADLVLLPELFHMLYPGQDKDPERFNDALLPDGPLLEALAEEAANQDLCIAAPFFERRMSGVYANSLMLIEPGGEPSLIYRKTHIPDDPGFGEKYYFSPGEEGYFTWDVHGVKAAPLICWDQWFPEAARVCALQGAEVLLYPTAIGWLDDEAETDRRIMTEAWQTVQRSHAITNGCYIAVANRVGREPAPGQPHGGINFWGFSFIADPMGQVIAHANATEETVLTATIDPAVVESTRRTWPFLRDRRVDLYTPLIKR
jgi:N-carbamoylputrescine amidase